jgi:hypothetical protein
VPETPHDIAQLELQAQKIKGYLSRRTQSPPSPIDHALNQLVKGCQMAMYSAVLLADENRRLRTENKRQKIKKTKRRSYIAQGGVLTVQEGLNRLQGADLEPVEGLTEQLAVVSITASLDESVDVMLSSWARERCYELDFGLGLGKPEAVQRPLFIPCESLIYLLPKTLDGQIGVVVCLRDEDMARLKADTEFTKYGNYIG